MTKVLKFSLIGIFAIFIIIQFVPNDMPENNDDMSSDLIQNEQVPQNIQAILKSSCYDCHSNQSVLPWYSHVAPSSWLVAKDIREGRDELNFSEWSELTKRKKIKKLNDLGEEVEKRKMPLNIYTVIHKDAVLTDAEIKSIVDWTTQMTGSMLGNN